jgi:cytoskeletal protein CcmA (bactofilin family)
MALFGKKENEDKSPAVQPPSIQKDIAKAQTKVAEKTAPKDATKETTYLGKNLKITGNVSGEGNLIILGSFEGEFNVRGQVKVAQGAEIKGNIKATAVSINGNIEGNFSADKKILLDTTATMKGRLVTPKISIQDGAVFDGELFMSRKPDQVPTTSTPEGEKAPKTPAYSEVK